MSDELKQINEKISSVEDESLASTRRMKEMLCETKQTGVKAAEELYEQGERLENINRNLDNINQDLKETKKNISNMRSFFSRIKSKFIKGPAKKDQVSDSNGSTNLISHNNNVKRFNFESTSNKASSNNNNAKFETITNSDREKDINNDLNFISNGVAELKCLALGLQSELDRQRPVVDTIMTKTESTRLEIQSQNEEIKKIK